MSITKQKNANDQRKSVQFWEEKKFTRLFFLESDYMVTSFVRQSKRALIKFCFCNGEIGIFQLMEGKLFMVRGSQATRHHRFMEMMFPHAERNTHFVSRMPRVLERFHGFLLPFSLQIWVIIFMSLLCLSIMFYVTHSVYTGTKLTDAGLHKTERFSSNFLLYTFCKITEPDPLPWFTSSWSTGKLLTFIWSMYSLLVMSFYNCNLRAHLSAVDYQKPLDNADQVLQHAVKTWLVTEVEETQ